MYTLKQMSSVCLIKTIWSPQATRTEICDFLPCKYLNKDSKKIAEPFFQLPFNGLFIKGRMNFHILLQNPAWEQPLLPRSGLYIHGNIILNLSTSAWSLNLIVTPTVRLFIKSFIAVPAEKILPHPHQQRCHFNFRQ